jgi:hypothetical protein
MGMKCINCGADNDLQDRTNNAGRCKQCNHPFAFEPSTETNQKLKFTDKFFEKAINDLSVTGSLYFTPKQLHYFLDRRLNKEINSVAIIISVFVMIIVGFNFGIKNPVFYFAFSCFFVWLILCITNLTSFTSVPSIKTRINNIKILRIIVFLGLIVSIGYSLYLSLPWLFVLSSIIGVGGLYLLQLLRNRQVNIQQQFLLTESKFEEIVKRWESINSPINKMLPIPSKTNTPANISSDITNYSFDRAVICDRPSIAQMLIANNFHFENSCAVLSVTGYPESIFDTVMTMLKRNPNLKVYVLHDASPKGIGLANYLRTNEKWFTDSNIPIYDVGLFPRQVFASQAFMFIINKAGSKAAIDKLPEVVKNSLSVDELAWLAQGNIIELESFTPQKIMQVLSQAISSSIMVNSDSSLFSADQTTDAYFYAESFG